MPFLTRKTGSQETDVIIANTLRAGGTPSWEDDTYRLSSQATGLLKTKAPASVVPEHTKVCANVDCTSGWKTPWRRRRPFFEGQWTCSGRCVLAVVRAAVRREMGEGVPTAPIPHRHRVPLGLLMLAQGWITQEQLRHSLEAQRERGVGRIGDWLKSECGLETEQVTRGLSMQWGCPVLTMDGFMPETMALVMPSLLVERFGLVPLRVAGSRILYVGSADRLDASVSLAVEKMTDLKVESGVIEEAQFESARSRLRASDSIEMKRESFADNDAMIGRITALLERNQPVASRFVRVHQFYWLRMWLESGTQGRVGSLPPTNEDMIDYLFTVGSEG
jgi:Type II secretion system (T2SS), protein E, N-terminal domain